MNRALRQVVIRTAVFSVILFTAVPYAHAGFEWKAPSSSGNEMPAQKVPDIESAPLGAPGGQNKTSSSSSEIISGFGKDVPLTIALQQIVPPSYTFSFASGVNSSMIVSWQGEKPWKQVLGNMLSRHGLDFSLENNAITIKSLAAPAEPVPLASSASKVDTIPSDMLIDEKRSSAPAAEPVTLHRDRPVAVESVPEVPEPTPPQPVAAEPEPVAPAAAAPVEVVWHASRGQTLRSILGDWTKNAQMELYWPIDYDYRLNSNVSYEGNFNEAVEKLFDQFTRARPQPYGHIYRKPDGQRILVVNSYDLAN